MSEFSVSIRKYADLVDKVSEIDEEAAYYLAKDAPKMESFSFVGDLMLCFYWDKTPQGHEYWDNLERKLYEKDEK